MRKLESSLTVDVPRKELDRPSWVRVGSIAAIGFVIGVAWPKLAGVRLGPSAPGESAAAAAAASSGSASARANDALAGTNAAASIATPSPATATAAPGATTPVAASMLTVKAGQITSCKTEDGETLKGKACGALGFDTLALPRLKRLAACPAATEADGKLSVMVHVDFAKSRVTSDVGKSSSVATPDAFAACLKPALEGAPLANVAHEHPRYTVNYALHFSRDKASTATPTTPAAVKPSTPAATPAATPTAQPTSAGTAGTPAARASDGTEIVWEVAIVRDAPRSGAVVARLPRGTKIQVGAPQDGWYKVKFDAAPNEGWVYRGSIGK